MTKCNEPNGEKALQLLKKHLAELQVERADLVYEAIGRANAAQRRAIVQGLKTLRKVLENP